LASAAFSAHSVKFSQLAQS